MSLQSKEDLIEKLRNKTFRDAFVSSRVSNTLAFQIRALRQKRGLSQTQLAKDLSTSQNAICRLESPHYGRPSITTLKKLASLFDVGLAVWFVPFSELVDRFTNLSTESLLVPAFDEENAERQSQTATATKEATLPRYLDAIKAEVLDQRKHEEFDFTPRYRVGLESAVQAFQLKQALDRTPSICELPSSRRIRGATSAQGGAP
ncbi:MAG: helix-turn-helix domain-containing protein [Acidobacteriia bacterium]|nr:helix-turn-helix domain-containing protein [Terriglobia bacterium]